jgi:DNA polymerase elongation subunit (family B)
MKEITTDMVNTFLTGYDPMEHIITIECDYADDRVNIIYNNEQGEKRVKKEDFKPFIWAKNSVCIRMFNGDRGTLRRKMREYGINVKALITKNENSEENERLENGYKYIFYSMRKMTYTKFLAFFTEAGTPVYEKSKNGDKGGGSKEFMAISPVEQYMIQSGRRLFKGYENYDDLKRFLFDLETQGLNPRIHAIDQIGMRTNKGFEKIITITGEGEERKKNELKAIDYFLRTIADEKPDIIAGHNSENFDWDFLIVRCEVLGTTFAEMSSKYFKHPIYKKKKEAILKLGGEMEYYKPTIAWGFSVLDSLHAVRRAQALDSNMKSASLKYTTKYLNLNKPNRVYVPGNVITKVWNVTDEHYAFRETDGDWYEITEGRGLLDGYVYKSGRYIVEGYLLDDLWETDKVELTLNESNFLVSKLLPTTFTRACTMGTAGIWKLIMLAWSYENNLAIPATSNNARFTGGLSRLLKTGYVDRIVKLDFNSLYPSIDLTWWVNTTLDIDNIMLRLLEYILTNREKYKDLKAKAGEMAKELSKKLENFEGSDEEKAKLKEEIAKWKIEKSANDKKQLPLKILANSFFGSYGCPMVFPFGDLSAAEKTTCIGRQSLRLMISHFKSIGYTPIVGDTDGFNFQMPAEDKFRYTDENPYIGKGLGRNVKKGEKYTKVEADVAEFEDLYFNHAWNGGINKMGLGIDEYCDATINFARKNYADLMPNGKTKKVGNTIKSRKMSGYLERFIDDGVNLLLHGNGSKFLSNYYDYIDKIYNYQIPIKEIASKGKIKKTLDEYKADCNTLTKAGNKKSRQAWYELAILNNLNVNVSDTIYYINTGTKKGHSDVKKVTHQFIKDENGEEIELTNKLKTELFKKELSKYNVEKVKDLSNANKKEIIKKYVIREEDEVILNCQIVPNEIIDDEKEILCSDVEGLEYNSEKYIEQFNNRIKPLLVCFSPDIRSKILVTNPKDRQYFTEEDAVLVSGYPNKEGDQDTYEALMTPEKKEIGYWLKVNEEPPFVKECGIDWDGLVANYLEEKKKEDNELFQQENNKYIEALNSLTNKDIELFEEEGELPQCITDVVTLDTDMHFYFKKIPSMTPSTGGFVFDDISYDFIDKNPDEV